MSQPTCSKPTCQRLCHASRSGCPQCSAPALSCPLLQGSDIGSECCHTDGATESPTASPTIPALRSTPFHRGHAAVPPLLPQPVGKSPLPALPQLALGLPGRASLQQQQQQQEQPGSAGRGLGVPIPRLDLSQSAHSTLETRNASAEMQLAADAEQAKARQGRGVLGELERSALGKGKVQAATVARKLNSALSGARGAQGGAERLREGAALPCSTCQPVRRLRPALRRPADCPPLAPYPRAPRRPVPGGGGRGIVQRGARPAAAVPR